MCDCIRNKVLQSSHDTQSMLPNPMVRTLPGGLVSKVRYFINGIYSSVGTTGVIGRIYWRVFIPSAYESFIASILVCSAALEGENQGVVQFQLDSCIGRSTSTWGKIASADLGASWVSNWARSRARGSCQQYASQSRRLHSSPLKVVIFQQRDKLAVNSQWGSNLTRYCLFFPPFQPSCLVSRRTARDLAVARSSCYKWEF
jgi:hypothetical protein